VLPLRRTLYLLLSFVLGTTWFCVLATGISTGLSLVVALVGIPIRGGLFDVRTLPLALAVVPLGGLLWWVCWHVFNALGRVHAAWARLILASSPDPELAARVVDLRSTQARIIEADRRGAPSHRARPARRRAAASGLALAGARHGPQRLEADGDATVSSLVADAHEESKRQPAGVGPARTSVPARAPPTTTAEWSWGDATFPTDS